MRSSMVVGDVVQLVLKCFVRPCVAKTTFEAEMEELRSVREQRAHFSVQFIAAFGLVAGSFIHRVFPS